MNITMQFVFETAAASLRRACDVRRAHLAVDLLLRNESRHRVDDEHVDRAAADQHLGDLKRLLAAVRLRYEHFFDVDAERLCVDRIERVFGVDERAVAAHLLYLGDNVKRHRRFTGSLRTVYLHDPAARQSADPERHIKSERAC